MLLQVILEGTQIIGTCFVTILSISVVENRNVRFFFILCTCIQHMPYTTIVGY